MKLKYSELRTSSRKNLVDLLPLEKPFTIQVDVSGRCCFRCVQCFQSYDQPSGFDKYKIDLSLDIFKKFIEDMLKWKGPKLKVLRMHMTGEPCMNSNFADMLKLAKSCGVAERVEFTTNGAVLTREFIEEIVDCEIDYVQVSIYSVIEKKHEAITGAGVGTQKIFDNVKLIKQVKEENQKEKPFVCAKMFYTYSDEDELFREIYEPIVDEILFQTIFNYKCESEEENYLQVYGSIETQAKAMSHANLGKSDKKACPYPFYMLGLKSNGDVTACHLDWEGDTVVGNILEDSIEKIWLGARLYKLQKMMLERGREENAACKKCTTFLYDEAAPDNIDGFSIERLIKNYDL